MRVPHRLFLVTITVAILASTGCGGSRPAPAHAPAPQTAVPLRIEMRVSAITDSAANARCSWTQVGLVAAGEAPPVGQATWVSSHCITNGAPPFLPVYDGRAVITAAGGDEIRLSYGLTELTTPAPMQVSSGTFTVTGGTGRFVHSTGRGAFRFRVDKSREPWAGWMILDGEISLDRDRSGRGPLSPRSIRVH